MNTHEACPDRRGALGAAAIGRLDEHELVALRAHLDGCAACRQELDELQSVAALLTTLDVGQLPENAVTDDPPMASPALSELVVERVRARTDRSSRRMRRRVGTVAAAVIGLAAAIALVLAVAFGNGPADRTAAHRTFVLRGTNATAKATLTAAGDGTDIAFRGRLEDVGGDPYWLWLTDASGNRLAAATFRDTADGSFSIRGHGAIPFRNVKRVWVTDQHKNVILDWRAKPATKA